MLYIFSSSPSYCYILMRVSDSKTNFCICNMSLKVFRRFVNEYAFSKMMPRCYSGTRPRSKFLLIRHTWKELWLIIYSLWSNSFLYAWLPLFQCLLCLWRWKDPSRPYSLWQKKKSVSKCRKKYYFTMLLWSRITFSCV